MKLDNFKSLLLLSDLFSLMVNESDVMENIDAPEAGLDALMQVLKEIVTRSLFFEGL